MDPSGVRSTNKCESRLMLKGCWSHCPSRFQAPFNSRPRDEIKGAGDYSQAPSSNGCAPDGKLSAEMVSLLRRSLSNAPTNIPAGNRSLNPAPFQPAEDCRAPNDDIERGPRNACNFCLI
ncbi:hypothetical protein CEXT_815261 [Caerostris extrusa]|uniref:Uncharacterized protein n=1 Tax=Caerostris extrusa TaxID=172846 RepID=A0AAV4U8C8_CAEEX|nr:hypothetical protein CEXT_815261 [Caerostris extrusa]